MDVDGWERGLYRYQLGLRQLPDEDASFPDFPPDYGNDESPDMDDFNTWYLLLPIRYNLLLIGVIQEYYGSCYRKLN